MRRALLTLSLLLAVPIAASACATTSGEDDSASEALRGRAAGDLPWEVRSRKGETYLANVFYADASDNEQIMPLTIGGRYQIDRLVYPTLGNPNLYDRSDAQDEFMTVLRVEKAVLAHLAPQAGARVTGSRFVRRLDLLQDAGNRLRFVLVSRRGREQGATTSYARVAEGPEVYEIEPTSLLVHEETPDMPDAFKSRWTVRAVFDHRAMAKVPAGLYDVRFEVLENGAVSRASTGQNKLAYEYQYNALRVFDRMSDDYSIVNVTDTQVSHSEVGRGPLLRTKFEALTLEKLREFVERVNSTTEPDVRNAAFITFNGDLHNGGSPEALRPSRVAWTYNDEANAILDTLKDLRVPIFLTLGNHDGYAATGEVPSVLDEMLGYAVDWMTGSEHGTLRETVLQAEPKAWPGFAWDAYASFLTTIRDQPGGKHVDVHAGAYRRLRVPVDCLDCFADGWMPVPRSKRNFILYDGIYQWQRTYGPTYSSWLFGHNRYVNMNTYELRQHRRSGWGMYTVNYGGGMSRVQVDWLARELTRAAEGKEDVTILAHHDPRGGHNGKDYPYYFKPLEYRGLDQSAKNYFMGEIFNPAICDLVPDWAKSHDRVLSCMHDGLQEWMRADVEFDCDEANRYKDYRGSIDGKCDEDSYSGNSHPWYSGYALLDLMQTHPEVRTLLLGHTHYNSLEVLQAGQQIVPTRVILDAEAQRRQRAAESTNPLRFFSSEGTADANGVKGDRFITPGLTEEGADLVIDLAAAGHAFATRSIQGDRRELTILRATSNADLSAQKYVGPFRLGLEGDDMYGFATLHVAPRHDARGYALPQVNEVTFYMNQREGAFEAVHRISIDRTRAIRSSQVDATNPLCAVFHGAGSEACE